MGSLISILVFSSSVQFSALSTISSLLVLLTPYTKVEESFSIQATHDIMYIGLPTLYHHTYHYLDQLIHPDSMLANLEGIHLWLPPPNNISALPLWDHEEFPGPVARSFIGPLFLSLLTYPFTFIPIVLKEKFYVQTIARIILGVLCAAGFNRFANAVGQKYGVTTRRSLVVITLTQFHVAFYMSRTIPNTFALALTLYALSKWILRDFKRFIMSIAWVVIVFRFETAILFGWIILYELFYTKNMKIWTILKYGVPSGIMALTTSVLVDSHLWGRWVWPEGSGLFLNVFLNKSHEWGTHHIMWYFYSAIPRGMLFSLLLVPFASKKVIYNFLFIPCLFISCYSFLPHKELRFIIYCIPIMNVCAANAIAIMVEKFEGNKCTRESWLGNATLKVLGYPVVAQDIADQHEREREIKEKEEEEEEEKRRMLKLNPPKYYDSIVPTTSNREGGTNGCTSTSTCSGAVAVRKDQTRYRGRNKQLLDDQLDQQYHKITAKVLEKHKMPMPPNGEEPEEEEPTNLSCGFILVFILMGLHIWCNVGFTVYATLAAWNNYPGGEALYFLNQQIRVQELNHNRVRPSEIGVYVSNLAAQTGFTRFLQYDEVVYDKSPTFNMVANRTLIGPHPQMIQGNLMSNWKAEVADFSDKKLVFPVLEGVDLPFLQRYCTSIGTKSRKVGKITSSMESMLCHFGPNVRNCKIIKVINGFAGLDWGFNSKHLVVRTTPMLWVFKCYQGLPAMNTTGTTGPAIHSAIK